MIEYRHRKETKVLKRLKDKPEQSLWNYLITLQEFQNPLFALEKEENSPEVLKELSSRALEVGEEIEALLQLLEEEII